MCSELEVGDRSFGQELRVNQAVNALLDKAGAAVKGFCSLMCTKAGQ